MHHVGDEDVFFGEVGDGEAAIEEASAAAGERDLLGRCISLSIRGCRGATPSKCCDRCVVREDYRVRFEREADLASTLWHPHIVGVHDRGEVDGQLWISMDFVDGLNASELLTGGMPMGCPWMPSSVS